MDKKMLNVSVMLPTYGEYQVALKEMGAKNANEVKGKERRLRANAKQRMRRKVAIEYYCSKLESYWKANERVNYGTK